MSDKGDRMTDWNGRFGGTAAIRAIKATYAATANKPVCGGDEATVKAIAEWVRGFAATTMDEARAEQSKGTYVSMELMATIAGGFSLIADGIEAREWEEGAGDEVG